LKRLRHKIQDLVSYGSWEPLKFGRGAGPAISHICFADDLILVSEATDEQAVLIKDVLDDLSNIISES
jgi:hypothetical protein